MQSTSALPLLNPAMSFAEACDAVVGYLREAIPIGHWSVTHYDGEEQLHLKVASPSAIGLEAGARVPWAASMCQFAVSGASPEICPDAMADPHYASIGRHMPFPIGTYVGIPIKRSDGSLFGTICGVDNLPQPPSIIDNSPLLHLLASLLGAVLEADLSRTENARAIERLEMMAETDALTGVYNRRAWDRYASVEERRLRTFGDPAGVIILDLDGLKQINDTEGHTAGDSYIKRAAATIRSNVRSRDVVARLGGDEFGVIAVPASRAESEILVDRLRTALDEVGVASSIGVAPFHLASGFASAIDEADRAMYEDKRQRKAILL